MKRERRHELETNQLADWLAKKIEAIKPYQNAILGLVVLVVVSTVAYVWWAGRATAKEEHGWEEFYQAFAKLAQGNFRPADFEAVIEQYPDTAVADWAAVIAGDARLAIGCETLFLDKAVANQELHEAVDLYLKIDSDSLPMLQERAAFGLARALEAEGDLAEAQKNYRKVTENWPEGTFAVAARRRLEDLQKASTKSLYDKFAKFQPKSQFADEPGAPGQGLEHDWKNVPEPPLPGQELPLLNLDEQGTEDDRPKPAPETAGETDEPDTDATDTDQPKPADRGKTPTAAD